MFFFLLTNLECFNSIRHEEKITKITANNHFQRTPSNHDNYTTPPETNHPPSPRYQRDHRGSYHQYDVSVDWLLTMRRRNVFFYNNNEQFTIIIGALFKIHKSNF